MRDERIYGGKLSAVEIEASGTLTRKAHALILPDVVQTCSPVSTRVRLALVDVDFTARSFVSSLAVAREGTQVVSARSIILAGCTLHWKVFSQRVSLTLSLWRLVIRKLKLKVMEN